MAEQNLGSRLWGCNDTLSPKFVNLLIKATFPFYKQVPLEY